MTKFPDLFASLALPFEPNEVKARTQAGRQLHYITARTVMNRLDNVLGPKNWWDDYSPNANSVLCRLTLRLPDGSTITKADAGGYAGMADSGDDDKSGYSDAFKRAAVKFGVARYLYRDGVPSFVQATTPETHCDPAPITRPDATPGDVQKSYPAPRHGGALFAWAKEQSQRFSTDEVKIDMVKWLDTWGMRKNLPGNFKEWAPGEITEGYNAAVEKLNRHVLEKAGKSEDQE